MSARPRNPRRAPVTTIARQHRCALPDVYGATHGPGDVLRCETCDTYYLATLWGAYQLPYRWKRISGRRAQRLSRG